MKLSRRALAMLPFSLGRTAGPLPATAASPSALAYSAGVLSWPGGRARAVAGGGGVRTDKREGDGASPAGTFPLLYAMYRPDRLMPPRSGLDLRPITRVHGWVDDPGDPQYNRLVALPYPAHHETLWRTDHVYDALVVIGYNTDPVVRGAGSAIFLHVARRDFSPTAGCIAVAKPALLALLGLLGAGSTITIRP